MLILITFISLEDLKDKKHALIFLSGIGAISFIILTFIAMLFYPRPYNFFTDHFSMLGLINANPSFFGRIPPGLPLPNPISSILFMSALTITAVATVPFWIIITSLFEENRNTKILSRFGSIVGLISSPLLIGIAFPADVYLEIHSISTMWFFLLFAVAIMIYTIAIFLNENYPNEYAIFGVIVVAVAILYVFIPFTPLNAMHQKIAVYLFIAWPLLQAKKIWNEI